MRVVWSLLIGFGIAFGESGLGIGMFLPGETAIVGLAATMPTWQTGLALGLLVAVGACAGDHVGYVLGRRYPEWLRGTRVVERLGVEHLDRATELLRRRGGLAVFGTRVMPVLRTVTPAAAGIAQVRYVTFVRASFAGSCLWAGLYVGGGSVVGALADAVDGWVLRLVGIGVVVVVTVDLPLALIRFVGGTRPVSEAPDVHGLERALDAPRQRRATFSPLIGEVQLRR